MKETQIPEAWKNHNHQEEKILYLKETCPGIRREKRGQEFVYYTAGGKRIKDADILTRIKGLVIPPAWRDVWISPHANSHLQATGIDAKGRKQYRYHPEWNKKRSETKFSKLTAFARALPKLRAEVAEHLKHKAITKDKVVALVVELMSKSYIRIGNGGYAKENGSYGLTTLRHKHVKIHGDDIRFVFKGKKGVHQDIELHDKKLARMVKTCQDIPGQELFQYYDEAGNRHCIDSGSVNHYLHSVCGEGFSAKDFRTWAGTLHAFKFLAQLAVPKSETEFKHIAHELALSVSKVLGNTPAVCRKYYIHPLVLEAFHDGRLQKFVNNYKLTKNKSQKMAEEAMVVAFLDNAF